MSYSYKNYRHEDDFKRQNNSTEARKTTKTTTLTAAATFTRTTEAMPLETDERTNIQPISYWHIILLMHMTAYSYFNP